MYFATTYGTEQVEQSDVQLQEKSEKSFDCQMEIEGKAHCRTSVKFLSETDAKSFDVIMTTCCKLNS